ncbi:FAD binding domain-containing protein [Streptomyces canarius]
MAGPVPGAPRRRLRTAAQRRHDGRQEPALQRTRCPYFQDLDKPCNKREPGSGCGARDGVHRDHAVLGHSPRCIATHPSDMAVALAALDAQVELYGTDGTRRLPVAELPPIARRAPRAGHLDPPR